MSTQSHVVLAYRQLYKASLQAIQFSSPARHTLKRLIRTEFRLNKINDYSHERVQNTLWFLQGAAQAKGLEHRIVKTMLHFLWFQNGPTKMKPLRSRKADQDMRHRSLSHMQATLEMLNESMLMCLPTDLTRRLDPLEHL